MKILVILERSPKHRFLVHLHTKNLVREVKGLVASKKYTQAMVTALSRGIFEKEVTCEELPTLSAGLILSEESASWDLLK